MTRGSRARRVIHTADTLVSFALIVGLALGAIAGAGIARIVGWGHP